MGLSTAYAVVMGSATLAGLTNLETSTNPEIRSEVGIGSQFPQFSAVVGVKPRVQFSSNAIKNILAVTGSTGAPISTASTLKAYFAALVDGVPAAGTVHQIYTFDRGLLLPRRLQCSHQADATIDVEAVTYSSNGVLAPLVQSTGALPMILRDNIRHTLESVSIGGVPMGCITDVSIDFGVNAETVGCKSDIYDAHISKSGGVTATITITTLDIDKLSSAGIPLQGKAATHANTSIVLRKRSEDGILFATGGDLDNITITANGIATVQTVSGQGPQNAIATIQLTCAWDGTNAPILIALT